MGLEKDPSIRNFIAELRAELGPESFQIVDHWADDLCAIGLAYPAADGVLAYVSTVGMKPGHFPVHLKIPPPHRSEFPYMAAAEHDELSYTEAVEIICEHFRRVA